MKDEVILTAAQKALKINLDTTVYGTFSEIGAGQETVRHFFRAGGASNTIAKAMSAYDKDFSDEIYGTEDDHRYVSESRLYKMISHEYRLISERLSRAKHPNKKYFSFANTVTTINFTKSFKGHGWMGIRFQTSVEKEPNDVAIHIRMHENEARYQQETIGIMGVNLLYAAYYFYQDPKAFIQSLFDNISIDAIEIDFINFSGPDFVALDNRLMSLQLIKHGFTEAVIFGPDGNNILPADLLYKKNILAMRGSFRPVTLVNTDMLDKGLQMFSKEKKVDQDQLEVLFEITLKNLLANGELDERDFLDRAELLCALGHSVLISNFPEYYKLIDYFDRYSKKRLGIVMGVESVMEIFNEKSYRGLRGGVLEAFGRLFSKDLKIYVYPSRSSKDAPLMTLQQIKVHPRIRPFFDYLLYNGRILDIKDYNPDVLHIHSREVLEQINTGTSGWQSSLPKQAADLIIKKDLFAHNRAATKSIYYE